MWMDMYEGTGFNSIEDPGWALSMLIDICTIFGQKKREA